MKDKSSSEEAIDALKGLEYGIYGIGYGGSSFVLRQIFKTEASQKALQYLSDNLSSDAVHFSYDVARYQMGSMFGAASYAKILELASDLVMTIHGTKLSDDSEKYKRPVISVISMIALTSYEIYQSTLPNRSFDVADMCAYLIGIAIFLCTGKLYEHLKNSPLIDSNDLESKALNFAAKLESAANAKSLESNSLKR